MMEGNCWGGKCANLFPPAMQVTLMAAFKMPQMSIPPSVWPFCTGQKGQKQPKKSWTQKENPPELGHL